MEARNCWYFGSALLFVCASIPNQYSHGQSYQAESENFVVHAGNAQLAKKASLLAEQYRKQLSLEWLGYEIETWRERCPIYIQIGPHAGGETSFAFVEGSSSRNEPIGWQMKIYGPVDRLLDAVLPHEVTHTIFATHFGRPLPRWADEGACTTVEHESERAKNHQMLLSFLSSRPSRGIPFNRMFTMKQYPHDILPLYAQGYSVARYLIGQKGRQHFVQFLENGMSLEQSNYDTSAWDQAMSEYYDFKDLSDLQLNWEKWVRSGSPEQRPIAQIASTKPVPNASNIVDPQGTYTIAKNTIQPNPMADSIRRENSQKQLNSWYARESRAKQAVRIGPENSPEPAFRPGSLKRGQLSTNSGIQLKSNSSAHPKSTLWR